MSLWRLPKELTVGGRAYAIRTDFRDVLHLLDVFADPEYEPDEKAAVCLRVMYPDWESIPQQLQQAAVDAAVGFIDGGVPVDGKRRSPRLVDWQQDGPIIIPAVNPVLGQEVRAAEYIHWWTFLGAYMELGECLFSTVLGLRQKRAKGKKLEKYEQEFLKENRALVELHKRRTPEDEAQRAALKKLFV